MQADQGIAQRKRQSSITDITRKSWNNLRAKLVSSKVRYTTQNKSEFLVISSDLSSERRKSDGRISRLQDPSDQIRTEMNIHQPEQNHQDDEGSNKADSQLLGIPDDNQLNDQSSETNSNFSFDRKPSFHYYKPSSEGIRSSSHRESSISAELGSFGSIRSCILSSIDGDFDEEDPYAADNFFLDEQDLDFGEEEDSDIFAELVEEANMLPCDEDGIEDIDIDRRRWSSNSIHRQLSQVTRNDLIITFFDDVKPKRAKSVLSTHSNVWPIQEEVGQRL